VKSALFKEMSYPLPNLMEDIDMGVIGLPDTRTGVVDHLWEFAHLHPELSASGATPGAGGAPENQPSDTQNSYPQQICRTLSPALST
jgi:hypothetical protein